MHSLPPVLDKLLYKHQGIWRACRWGYAGICTCSSDRLLHGESLYYEELALVEPLAIGAHAIRRAAVKEGEFVLVVGAGSIGLGIMEFARIAGAKVIAIDVNDNHLQFCIDLLNI